MNKVRSKSCRHNSWDGYALIVLRNKLNLLKRDNPENKKFIKELGVDIKRLEKQVAKHKKCK